MYIYKYIQVAERFSRHHFVQQWTLERFLQGPRVLLAFVYTIYTYKVHDSAVNHRRCIRLAICRQLHVRQADFVCLETVWLYHTARSGRLQSKRQHRGV